MAEPKPMTVPEFRAAKGRRLAMVTAYDYTSARIADAAGIDALLVGDSLGMVVQGNNDVMAVTTADVAYHTRCVARGAKRPLLVADLPFGSYQVSPRQAVRNAVRLVRAGAQAVKLEGGPRSAAAIRALVAADIPVMGHIGLTPQSVHRLGGFKVQRAEEQLLTDARAVQEAGAFAVVVEAVPADLGRLVTEALTVPTVGIGAGPHCDGQILVWHDLLGLYPDFRPRFAKAYGELGRVAGDALSAYLREVRDGTFPGPEHSFR